VIEKYGRKGTEFEGIFFTEGPIQSGAKLGLLQVESRKQNTTLNELKHQLAERVKGLGGNALQLCTTRNGVLLFKYEVEGNRKCGSGHRGFVSDIPSTKSAVIGFWNPLYALVALALGFFGLFPPILGFLKRMGQSKADKSKR
jgi:hypothetical protein